MVHRTELSEFLRVFFRMGRYFFIVGSFTGVGIFMFNRFTPSEEDIKKQYESDPVSRHYYQASLDKQRAMKKFAFEQAGITESLNQSIGEDKSAQK